MPEEHVLEQARKDKAEGKSPSTQAGGFVREEIHHIREGKHGARSPQQAIAIGLSKARRAGVELPAPRKGSVSAKTRAQAEREIRKGRKASKSKRKVSRVRSNAAAKALKRKGRSSATRASLSRHAHASARQRSARSRRSAAKKASRTRGKVHR